MEYTNLFRPLLAPLNSPADTPTFFSDIRFPQMVSPKIDGIRGVVREVPLLEFHALDDGHGTETETAVLSRNLEKFRSVQVQELFSGALHADGELAYDPTAPDCLHVTQSHVRSRDKPCDTLGYYVFDWCDESVADQPYFKRHELLTASMAKLGNSRIEVIPQIPVDSVDELLQTEDYYLQRGYEGVMFRSPVARYKHNRATYNEDIIYKLKRFTDEEGIITGFIEGKNNLNAKETDARGYAKRAQNEENKVPNGMVGKILVTSLKDGQHHIITPGVLKHAQRKYIWENQSKFLNKICTYRFFGYGMKDAIRFGRFISFREKWDMS